jgi:nicotinamidase-related amidase
MNNLSSRELKLLSKKIGTLVLATIFAGGVIAAQKDPYAEPEEPGLPPSNMELDLSRTAIVITDPQIDFLSPDGVTWALVGNSVTSNRTVENIEQLLKTAKKNGIAVFVSPHYYFPTDHGWKFEGALEKVMHAIGMFDRLSAYSMEGFENFGADFMPQYKPYLFDDKTIITSPHKVYGPEQNDLVLQLRKQHIDQILLAGMSANLCVQAHMHELLEQGFDVAVIKDATAAAQILEGDGYMAALINFRFMANALWTTDQAVDRLSN